MVVKIGLIDRLQAKGAVIVVNTQCQQINNMGVVITNKQGEDSTVAADSVVLAVGAKPDVELLESIKNLVPEVYLVGDAVEPRRILNAISEGYQVGLSI
jgi:thioredoxin reductase